MLWSRKSTSAHDKARHVGIDVTASRLRAVSIGMGKVQPLVLDEPHEDLPLFIALDKRVPEVGRAGYALVRKMPHAVCSNFLPALTQTREWRNGRHALTAEAALELAFARIRGPLEADAEAVALVTPAYLSPAQVGKVVTATVRTRLPLMGTAVGPLAVVADRAISLLTGKAAAPELPAPDWVVPMRPAATGPGSVVVLDADEHALSATVVAVERDRVRVIGSAAWPKYSARAWKDRLLDAISDRCVRLCRRDPRDSADAEQALFEQLDSAVDRARAGYRVNLTVRTDRWFQDVTQHPDEIDTHCAALARGAGEVIRDLIGSGTLEVPPRALWLTHEAGRLPGLARSLHTNTPERTVVEVLPPVAVARAASALVPRWQMAELPRAHLDTVIMLPSSMWEPVLEKPTKQVR
jgi:hypothetical protein